MNVLVSAIDDRLTSGVRAVVTKTHVFAGPPLVRHSTSYGLYADAGGGLGWWLNERDVRVELLG